MSEYDECERCGNERADKFLKTVDLGEDRLLCEGCERALREDVDYYDAEDRYTEEHHERVVSELQDYDEVQCVIHDYEQRLLFVHTPYVSSKVVADICNTFGLQIRAFRPFWPQEREEPCAAEHGETFEIALQYTHYCKMPASADIIFEPDQLDDLTENEKQF